VNIGSNKSGKVVKSGKINSGKQTLRFPRTGGPARIEEAVSQIIIDHIYVSSKQSFCSFGQFEFAGSDHDLIYVVKKFNGAKLPPKIIEFRCIKKMDSEAFCIKLCNKNWSEILSTNPF